MDIITLMQWIGAVGIGLFYPIQNWRAFVAKNPVGLSFLAFSSIAIGIAGYISLGIRLEKPIFYGLNSLNLFFAFLLLGLIWRCSSSLSKRERVAGIIVLVVGLFSLAAINIWMVDIAPTVSGWIGLAGIVGFYPIQNARLFKSRDPTGLSLTACIFLFIGLCSLAVFGVMINDITVSLGNGLTALGTIPILYGILRWNKK